MIAGIDLSTLAVHICSLPEDSDDAQIHIVRLNTEPGNQVTRLRRLRDRMPSRTAWRDAGITLIALERPYSHQAATLAPMMLAYGGILQLLPPNVPILELPPQTWRNECGLPQRGDEVKPAAIRFARRHWTTAPDAMDDNVADSFCVAWAARAIDLRGAQRAA